MNERRSRQFWFRMIGLLATLASAWVAYALDRPMHFALIGASAFALAIALGDED